MLSTFFFKITFIKFKEKLLFVKFKKLISLRQTTIQKRERITKILIKTASATICLANRKNKNDFIQDKTVSYSLKKTARQISSYGKQIIQMNLKKVEREEVSLMVLQLRLKALNLLEIQIK